MPRIIIQAGHEGRTTGSTGAPGEQAFNKDVADKLTAKLQKVGFEVKRVTADPTSAQISGDWDLFFAIHYDADIYGKGGFFVDYPEPSTDGATAQSQRITGIVRTIYAQTTGIVDHPERSNKNTRYYYMWSKLSAKTPCVLIECGVGQHKPDDYEVLFNQRDKVIDGLYRGIINSFGVTDMGDLPANYGDIIHNSVQWEDTCKSLELGEAKATQASAVVNAVGGYKADATNAKNKLAEYQAQVDNLAEQVSRLKGQLSEQVKETNRQIERANLNEQKFIDEAKAKGALNIKLQAALNDNESLKQQLLNDSIEISWGDLFQLFLKQKVTISKKSV